MYALLISFRKTTCTCNDLCEQAKYVEGRLYIPLPQRAKPIFITTCLRQTSQQTHVMYKQTIFQTFCIITAPAESYTMQKRKQCSS